jgi:hypothetical protein
MSHPKKVKVPPARVAAFLRARHPVKTAAAAAAETGVAAETIKTWLKGAAQPGFSHLLALITAYGPEFLSALLPEAAWLDAARRAAEQRALEDEIAAAQRRFAELTRPEHGQRMAAADRGGDGWRGALAGAAAAQAGGAVGHARGGVGRKG